MAPNTARVSSAIHTTSLQSNNPRQSGLASVPRSRDITVDPRDLPQDNTKSTGVGSRRATSGPMSGGRHPYADILRNTPPRERIDGAPGAMTVVVPGQQSRTRSPRPSTHAFMTAIRAPPPCPPLSSFRHLLPLLRIRAR